MKSTLLRLLLFVLFSLSAAVSVVASPTISLLTAGPTDEEVFFLYGHTGIRVRIPEEGYDYVFNYGYFSLQQPNFYLNFILGKPLYMLGVTPMESFLEDYRSGGRSVTEQVLNLSEKEAEEFLAFLEWNARPENAQYRYNFFFDNCATRPRDLIEKFSGGLTYHIDETEFPTFREAAREKSESAQWYTFGADICLGSQSDKRMTAKDAAYLPELLMKEMDSATRNSDGAPIVLSKTELLPQTHTIAQSGFYWPGFFFSVLVAALFVIYFFVKSNRLTLNLIATLFFSVMGILGITLWFLAFLSAHPHTFPNENLLLYHPFWFLLIPLLYRKDTTGRTLYQDLLFWLFTASLGLLAVLVIIPGGQVLPRGELLLWLSAILLVIYTFYPDPKRIGKPNFRTSES